MNLIPIKDKNEKINNDLHKLSNDLNILFKC